MVVRVGTQIVPRERVGLSPFGWDRVDAPSQVELVLDLDPDDLRALGAILVAHATEWVKEDPAYFEDEDMRDVARPLAEDLFAQDLNLLRDYLAYSSFWHRTAGEALVQVIRGGGRADLSHLLTGFVDVEPRGSGARVRLRAVISLA